MAVRVTVPARGAVIDASIFIASIVATVRPCSTVAPLSTASVTTPANGAATWPGFARSAFSAGFVSTSTLRSRTVTGRIWPLRVVTTVRMPWASASETAPSSISSVTPGSSSTVCSTSRSRP